METAKKLDTAIEFLNQSRRELEAGKVVALEGFQNEVREICADIAALPNDIMLSYSPKIQQLSETLKILEQELREQQTSVQQQLFGLNRKQKALQSYETVSHSDKKQEE